MAVQVDPIKPKLKLPGTKRFKLTCDILLSRSAFKFNLLRFIKEDQEARQTKLFDQQEKKKREMQVGPGGCWEEHLRMFTEVFYCR